MAERKDIAGRLFHAPPTAKQRRWLARAIRNDLIAAVAAGINDAVAKELDKPMPITLEAAPAKPAREVDDTPLFIAAGICMPGMAMLYGWPWAIVAYAVAGAALLAFNGRAKA